ncbi:MAG: type II toxin-antitoxin system RelE/ParE family toxin [Burkholderiales bacterium]
MAEYRLTPAAEHDLETVWTHTAQQWGAGQANRYTDILTATFADLPVLATSFKFDHL